MSSGMGQAASHDSSYRSSVSHASDGESEVESEAIVETLDVLGGPSDDEQAPSQPAPAPKRRGRPPKDIQPAPALDSTAGPSSTFINSPAQAKRPRGRPPKIPRLSAVNGEASAPPAVVHSQATTLDVPGSSTLEAPASTPKRRGRPPKHPQPEEVFPNGAAREKSSTQSSDEAPAPKRPRGRPRLSHAEPPAVLPPSALSSPVAKRGPGRPRKSVAIDDSAAGPSTHACQNRVFVDLSGMQPPGSQSPKRGPGRPRKSAQWPDPDDEEDYSPPTSASDPPAKRGPGRPRKSLTEASPARRSARKPVQQPDSEDSEDYAPRPRLRERRQPSSPARYGQRGIDSAEPTPKRRGRPPKNAYVDLPDDDDLPVSEERWYARRAVIPSVPYVDLTYRVPGGTPGGANAVAGPSGRAVADTAPNGVGLNGRMIRYCPQCGGRTSFDLNGEWYMSKYCPHCGFGVGQIAL